MTANSSIKKEYHSLEYLRGLACLVVCIAHIRIYTPYFKAPKYDFIQMFTAWGKESVIIFFILSGIVINISTSLLNGKGHYFKKRIIRIVPIYLICILITSLVGIFLDGTISGKILLGNIFMLGTEPGFIVPAIPYNPPVWSLSCEAFFYILFGLSISKNTLQNVWFWFILSIASIFYRIFFNQFPIYWLNHFLYMLNFSFIWLLGYLIYQYRAHFSVNLPTALMGILMVPMATRLHGAHENFEILKYHLCALYMLPLFIYLLNKEEKTNIKALNIRHAYLALIYVINLLFLLNYSHSQFISKILYAVLPITSFLFYFNIPSVCIKTAYKFTYTSIKYLAKISYSVYLIHVPIMYFVSFLIPVHSLLGIPLIIATILLTGIFLDLIFQNKFIIPQLNKLL